MQKIRSIGSLLALALMSVFALASPAGAQYVDPTNGEVDAAVTSVTDFITNTGLPAMLAVAVIGVIVAVAVKYVRKLRSVA